MSTIQTILAFLLVLIPIVLVHELGHFIAAVKLGVRVEEFGIGLPPRALTLFKHNGTIYSLNWLPLGGFVRPAGEDDPSVPGGLASASKRVRFIVLVAGAAANFLLAFLLFWFAFSFVGEPVYAVALGGVDANLPADLAGLQAGDIILAVEGQEVKNTTVLVEAVQKSVGQPLELTIERAGTSQTIIVTPIASGEGAQATIGRIGVSLGSVPTGELSRYPIFTSMKKSVERIVQVIALTLRVPIMIFQGEMSFDDAGFVGPVNIARISSQAAQASAETGNWFPFLSWVALVNVALGFTNLLPIPALDGGRILFVMIEALRGRRISPEREATVHMVAMIFLLCLMVLIFVNDILNPITLFSQ